MSSGTFELNTFLTKKGASWRDYQARPGNILVVSPHPDDDVLGAGGTMISASAQGKGVFSIYITQGGGSPRRDRNISDDEMAIRREEEAKSSLRKMGAAGGIFLRKKSEEILNDGGD
jgi:LmbE family N-acetylglucosaminyl deacetylase